MNQPNVTILVVEDDPSQLELLAYNIESEGYTVLRAEDGNEAILLFHEYEPDIILLDWMLPQVSGLDVCRRIKKHQAHRLTPVLILSARTEEEDRVKGLESGADDYVVKPYSISELLARLRAHLRRTRPSAVGETLVYEDIVLHAEEHRVFRDGKPVKVGPTEFRLLATFLERPGRVWSRDQLLERVWGRGIYVGDRTVDVHMGRLRKSLRAYGGTDPFRTVRGAGYSLG